MADLGDGGHVDGVVQLGVAAGVEPVSFRWPAGRFDGGGAVVGGEPLWAGEPAGVTDVTEDEPSHDRADAVELEECRCGLGDGVSDPGSGGDDLTVEASDVA